MPELSSGVKQRLEDATSGEDVSLIVTLREETTADTEAEIEATGAVVEMKITDELLVVRIDEHQLPELVEVDGIEELEIEGDGQVLQADDFRHPAGSHQ